MCGIFACFNYGGDPKTFRKEMLSLSKCIRHRGPDWTGVHIEGCNALVHERLSIVDVNEGGNQPLVSKCTGGAVLIANGEIYNHLQLREQLKEKHDFTSESDSEIILHLYEEFKNETPKYLDGDFAFILFDGSNYLVARDPIGVVPLYQGWGDDGSIWFASEMKCLKDHCQKIILFPPGSLYDSKIGQVQQWYHPFWYQPSYVPTKPADLKEIKVSFEKSVVKRLMADVPYGVLLSGGLDSSLVASVICRQFRKNVNKYAEQQTKIVRMSAGSGAKISEAASVPEPILHSFSIGLKGAPDLKAAQEVADFLGTEHHEFHFTVQEGVDAIPDVIQHIETYNVSTVQASTAMYLLSRKIKTLGVKMVLSGEGADELFGGYLYFHQAPSAEEFHKECVDRVKHLHNKGCLRANKSTMAWGLEVRVPFLDKDFVDVALGIDAGQKMCIKGERAEKYLLRKAFDDPEDPYLPAHILWRQKEQFNDGVGYDWADGLRAHVEAEITDHMFHKSKQLFPEDAPTTKEAFYYRTIFESIFSNPACRSTIKRWRPPAHWGCGAEADVTGRAENVHVASS